jgi:hypothetical protein
LRLPNQVASDIYVVAKGGIRAIDDIQDYVDMLDAELASGK